MSKNSTVVAVQRELGPRSRLRRGITVGRPARACTVGSQSSGSMNPASVSADSTVTTLLESPPVDDLWDLSDLGGTDEEVESVAADSVTRSKDFETLVLKHLNMLYAVALRLTRNPTDAQDLTQNTLVKVLRFHNHFKNGTYIKAWMLTILRNTFINEYRRRKRGPCFVELTGSGAMSSPAPDPTLPFCSSAESSADVMELVDDKVKAAIESLSTNFRMAVIMADLRGKSYKEIAAVMGCPLGTVMSRLYRGRKILRQRLYEYAKERRLAGSPSNEYMPAALAVAAD